MPIIAAAPTQIARKCHRRIDDQGTARVMRAYFESNLMPASEDILPGHFAPISPEALIDQWPAMRNPLGIGLQSEIARPVDFDFPGAAKGKADGTPG